MNEDIRDTKTNTLAVILSGGAGRRFEGHDKGLQTHRGRALIEWVIAAIEPQVAGVVLCINRNKSTYVEYGFPLVFDSESDHQGPMAGVVAAANMLMENEQYRDIEQILVSSCDSPDLPDDYVGILAGRMGSGKYDAAVVHDGQRKQNLHCLIRRSAIPKLVEYYHSGGRAMHRWYQQVNLIEVDFSAQAKRFLNINFPEQLD